MDGATQTPGAPRKYYTREQVAEELQVALRTVDEWIANDLIPHCHLGRTVRIPADKLRDALDSQTVFPSNDGLMMAMQLSEAQLDALRRLFQPVLQELLDGRLGVKEAA